MILISYKGAELGKHDNVQHSENDTLGPCRSHGCQFVSTGDLIDHVEVFGEANRNHDLCKFRATFLAYPKGYFLRTH